MKVTLFIPCFVDLFYPQVGVAMVRILEKLGHKVVCPEGPACCGQPAFNTGYWDESRDVAIKVMESLQGRGGGGHCQRLLRRHAQGVLPGAVRGHEV